MRRLLCLPAIALLAGCASEGDVEAVPPAKPAEHQLADVRWRESYPSTGRRPRFAVERIEVRRNGWSVEIAVTNETGIPFRVEPGQAACGLMLFATGDLEALT